MAGLRSMPVGRLGFCSKLSRSVVRSSFVLGAVNLGGWLAV